MLRRSVCFALLAGGLGLPPGVAAEPVQVFSGTAHDALYGLCLDGQQGIAVGSSGFVIESADGGQSWTPGQNFTESALLDVSCGVGSTLIVAQQGGIFRSENGAFKAVDSGTDARLLGVDSNSHGLAVAVGSFGTILRSTDDGVSWKSLPLDWEAILNDFVEPHLYAVDVSPTGVITIVGEFELVIRSTDGGETWETAHKAEASLFGLTLNADGSGFAVGQNGRIIKTEDGGISWSQLPSPAVGILLNVWSGPDGEVLVSGIRNLLRSSDGGLSWKVLEGGDLNTGWYQGLVVTSGASSSGAAALLAGHHGNVLQVQLN
jgi:photosystem II stability/assembly factor-like uncharacterized protein